MELTSSTESLKQACVPTPFSALHRGRVKSCEMLILVLSFASPSDLCQERKKYFATLLDGVFLKCEVRIVNDVIE